MGLGIVHVGEHVVFGIVKESGDLAKARAELVGDVAPGFTSCLAVGLNEHLPGRAATRTMPTAMSLRTFEPKEFRSWPADRARALAGNRKQPS